ncbi:MAG: pyruvate formate lyase family protein [Erysipelotrichaceae bacterium]|nr:pyruvate formate lyase family protein [Erysipelotrichaceae bacterium]
MRRKTVMAKEELRKTNIEIKPKLKCEKPVKEQLEIMELYTETYKANLDKPKEIREIECLKVIYPRMLRTIMPEDLLAGRLDYLQIGFGCVTSVGGVGHYCHFYNLQKFIDELDDPAMIERAQNLFEYWKDHDVARKYVKNYSDGVINIAGNDEHTFDGPILTVARLSGMMLDYNKLMEKGIRGLREEIIFRKDNYDNLFYDSCLQALDLFTACADYLCEEAKEDLKKADSKRAKELNRIIESLQVIRTEKPTNFHQALQAVWLYALMAGCINYGRLDDVVGEFLQNDLDNGVITYEEAHDIVKSLWTMIENKRTTVNGRVIVGGRGRKNPKAADTFARICLDVCDECRYVEPQFTLRIYEDTPEDIWNKAVVCLSHGATFPTLYNDAVTVPGLMNCMRVTEKEAEQYAMFGCGEMNLVGMTVGTPNSNINETKVLTILLNEGVDPWDNVYKAGPLTLKKLEEYKDFEEFYAEYERLHYFYANICGKAQQNSYKQQSEEVSYLFVSMLMNDCIARGKALLDGGVRYRGGCCETYGNINCSDGIYAIKKLVFDDKKYTLREINNACINNFEGYEQIQKDMKDCNKYGNDQDDVDEIACRVYNTVSRSIRDAGIRHGLHYYGIVIINNQTNTDWGLRTAASPDGRTRAMFMNPSNNPQGGADKSGPTAMLNSLTKFDARYQVGQVQNIKFQTNFFKDNLEKIKLLFKAYFKKGGCQLMVTVIDKHALEDAMVHPEKYPNMIVRVSGFSAVFINLDKEVQKELVTRTLYEGI